MQKPPPALCTPAMTDEQQTQHRPMTTALRWGTAAGLLGIVAAALLGFSHLSFGSLFSRLPYGHYMLPAIALGLVAIGIAVGVIVRTGRYAAPLGVFAIGLAAVATPIYLGVGLLLLVLTIGFWLFGDV
jgi:hypothetical protein